MKYILFLLLLLTSSCMSVEKATSYLQKKGALAEVCAEEYPIREVLIPGETIVKTDTVTVEGETVECPISDKPTVVKCPPVKVQVKHSFRVDTLIQENTAKTDMYKQKYFEQVGIANQLTTELSQMKESRNKWRSRCIGLFILLGTVIVLYLVMKRYIPFF